MRPRCCGRLLAALTVLSALALPAVQADEDRGGFSAAVSDCTIPLILSGGLALLTSGDDGHEQALQGAKALGAAVLATELLKRTVREKRPDSDEEDSFPSRRAALAFATATMVDAYRPEYRWYAYGGAALIAWSRVELGRHYWHDVVAGALLGHVVAKQFASPRVVVTPESVGLAWQW